MALDVKITSQQLIANIVGNLRPEMLGELFDD